MQFAAMAVVLLVSDEKRITELILRNTFFLEPLWPDTSRPKTAVFTTIASRLPLDGTPGRTGNLISAIRES